MRYLLWFGHRVMAYVQVTVEPLKLFLLVDIMIMAEHGQGEAPRRDGGAG